MEKQDINEIINLISDQDLKTTVLALKNEYQKSRDKLSELSEKYRAALNEEDARYKKELKNILSKVVDSSLLESLAPVELKIYQQAATRFSNK